MLDNTKQALKNIGKDTVDVVKATGKLAKDLCINLPKATCDDGRAHLAIRKEFLEWRKTRDTKSETPADTQ